MRTPARSLERQWTHIGPDRWSVTRCPWLWVTEREEPAPRITQTPAHGSRFGTSLNMRSNRGLGRKDSNLRMGDPKSQPAPYRTVSSCGDLPHFDFGGTAWVRRVVSPFVTLRRPLGCKNGCTSPAPARAHGQQRFGPFCPVSQRLAERPSRFAWPLEGERRGQR